MTKDSELDIRKHSPTVICC